jgi:hypothetical protein
MIYMDLSIDGSVILCGGNTGLKVYITTQKGILEIYSNTKYTDIKYVKCLEDDKFIFCYGVNNDLVVMKFSSDKKSTEVEHVFNGIPNIEGRFFVLDHLISFFITSKANMFRQYSRL